MSRELLSRELLIEKMAVRLSVADNSHNDVHFAENYRNMASAILSLLADPSNITDEMVLKAGEAYWGSLWDAAEDSDEAWLHSEPGRSMRHALAAAFAKERADNLTGERKP